ncbi:MAG: phosphoribosylaminoimidazolesuccinocarboxamide synthase [Clostridia bacterium]|nr:phosphoribosylaminoimidazolesuccinocarboxamide synthase [Clostridia bacterium]
MNLIHKGKVRDIYDVGKNLVLVTSDRISAFDVVLPNIIPRKGKVLNQMSAFWFDYVADICPNHMISTEISDMPIEFQKEEYTGRSMLVKKLKMLNYEGIVRGYLTGSGLKSYMKNGTICGIKLPEGLRESEKLPYPIFTPTTKEEVGKHDEDVTFEKIVNDIGIELATKFKETCIKLFLKASEHAEKNGLILADTKLEFGINEKGELCLGDEAFTPDSSRFWAMDDYEVGRPQKSFDKQYLRDWLEISGWNKTAPGPELPQDVIDVTSEKYEEAYFIITESRI